ncbi:MAG: hypothetical protein IKN17_06675 [Ruminococcus sp.]|nr:hypothetical protein [Ruminococcus sp.]
MNRVLTEKGRDDVRYIITRKTGGAAVTVREAVPVKKAGLKLLIAADNASDSCLRLVIKAVEAAAEEAELTAYFCTDPLTAESLSARIERIQPAGTSVCLRSDKALRTAFDVSDTVLTVPEVSLGGFFTLTPAGSVKLSGRELTYPDKSAQALTECTLPALTEALKALAERSTAHD